MANDTREPWEIAVARDDRERGMLAELSPLELVRLLIDLQDQVKSIEEKLDEIESRHYLTDHQIRVREVLDGD